MYRLERNLHQALTRQTGTTLIVALVLVLLASLLALFALNVGIFEQRASANDVRARLVQQAAESALAQGIEYINLQSPTILDTTDDTKWKTCGADEETFPCGAVEQCTYGASTCTSALQRRANMYRFIGGGGDGYDVNSNGDTGDVMEVRSLPLDRHVASVGNGFNVNYGVGALLCMVKTPSVSTDPTECTTDPNLSSGVNVLTMVATAKIAGESASTTLTTTIGRASSLFAPVNKPPVVASGTITTAGTFQVVTNPNSGGTGVPVSMWTRMAVDKNGTPNTCYKDAFMHGGSPIFEGSAPIVTCDSCNCPATDSLSFPKSGPKGVQQGIDIVDVDPSTPQCSPSVVTDCKPNLDIKPGEFPCDLFQYVFGDQAWTDDDGDFFCEGRLTAQVTANGNTYTIGEDENYLLAKANYILPNSNAPYFADLSKLTSATILSSCDDILDSSGKISGGMIWDQQGCGFKDQIGNPDAPVVLIEDGDVSINAGGRMFGLLFVRPSLWGATNAPPLHDKNILDPTTGAVATGLPGAGTGNLRENGHANIYGSVVIQGTANKILGTGAIVYDATILATLGAENKLNKISPVPGSWSDRYKY